MRYKKFLPFLLAFVLPLLAVYAWWGGFAPVEIREAVRGPHRYAYLEHTGDFAGLPKVQAQVLHELRQAGIEAGDAITVLYSNPDIVARGDRRARTGYLLPAGARPPAAVSVGEIPGRPVLTASVRAGILLAPSRAYQALDGYLQRQGRGIVMPTVEIYVPAERVYQMGVLTVEMDLAPAASTKESP